MQILKKVRRNKEANEFKPFWKVLNDEQKLKYGKLYAAFKYEIYSYKELETKFLDLGVEIKPSVIDISKRMMTIDDYKRLKERLGQGGYKYQNLNGIILNSEDFQNVKFYEREDVIRLLANEELPDYQYTLMDILLTKLRNSYDVNENVAKERKQIKEELESLREKLNINYDNRQDEYNNDLEKYYKTKELLEASLKSKKLK